MPEPVWAAALAANWDRKISDLVHDIYGDHRYMVTTDHTLLFVECQLHCEFVGVGTTSKLPFTHVYLHCAHGDAEPFLHI